MLVRVIIGNLYSFREKTEFNMLTGDVRRHPHHVHKLGKVEVLRTAAVYGANGAGKSNLVKALDLLRQAATSERIPNEKISAFKLGQPQDLPNSHIEIEVSLNKKQYLYGLSLTHNRVAEEWLYETNNGKEDVVIFERKTNDKEETKISFAPKYENTIKAKSRRELYENEILKSHTTMLWQLNQAKTILIKEASAIFDWMTRQLVVVYPNYSHRTFIEGYLADSEFKAFCNTLINNFNTGVTDLYIRKTLLNDEVLNQPFILKLIHSMGAGDTGMISFLDKDNRPFTLTKSDGHIYLNDLQTIHNNFSIEPVVFDVAEESDGTRRLLDLVVAFYIFSKLNMTVIVDEIERSVHPSLIKSILKRVIGEEQVKGQLIFTTHESNLLDLDMLRQDEIWFAEKNEQGATSFYPLSEFSIRPDLDIEKGYLMGRFGAIPMLNDLKKLNRHQAVHAEN